MKILVVSQYFLPEAFRINDLVIELSKKGHNLTILTGIPNYPTGKWFDGYGLMSIGKQYYGNIQMVRAPLTPRGKGRGWQLALNYLSFALFSSIFGPILCRDKYDVIFVYEPSPFTVGIPGMVMRWLKKAPMIFWVQDLWPESLTATGAVKSKIILNFVGGIVRTIYKHCDKVLVQSEAFIEPAIAAGAKQEHIVYYPNWAEDYYQPLTLPKNTHENKEMPPGFRIVFAGNLGAAQSLETIINAAELVKHLPNIHWVMIGDGRRLNWMKNLVKKRNLQNTVHFLGRKSADSMPRYFAFADLLLVTLRSEPIFSMTVPSKLQTYLACGRPVVAALDGEGGRIITESGAGLAVKAGDATGLAESVKTLYEMSSEDRQAMGNKGLEYYKTHFDRNMLVNQLENMMHKMVENKVCVS